MMTTSFISSLSLWNTPRSGVARLQTDLATATAEIASGRHADLGLALGTGVGRSLGLRQSGAEIAALKDANGVAALRLSASQSALSQIQKDADAMSASLIGLPSGDRAAAAEITAASALDALAAGLNASAGGQSLFGGINTAEGPLAPGAAGAIKAAVAAVFQTSFGVAPGSAGAAAITGQQMKDFLSDTGPVAALFSDAAWQTDVSRASSRTQTTQISLSESVTTSVSANGAPFRAVAMAYAIASATGLTGLSADAQDAATDRVLGLLSTGSSGLVALQADLGRVQAKVTAANTRLDSQAKLLNDEIGRLEAVDPAEAKSRVDALTTQVQMSYALTAQLRQLSLVSFIS
jgi:flagellar hook-associated protein 3 FlgL